MSSGALNSKCSTTKHRRLLSSFGYCKLVFPLFVGFVISYLAIYCFVISTVSLIATGSTNSYGMRNTQSFTLVHPAEAARQSKMPVSRDIRGAKTLSWGPSPTDVKFGGQNPHSELSLQVAAKPT